MSQTDLTANTETAAETRAETGEEARAVPYQGISRAAVDIASGSRTMTHQAWEHTGRALRSAWAAAWAGEKASDRFESLGIAALTGTIAVGTAGSFGMGLWLYIGPNLTPYLPLAGLASPFLWSATALLVARTSSPAEEDNTPNDHEESGESPTAETAEADPPDAEDAARALFRFVLAAVADAESKGVQGVHLHALLARLHEEARNFETWEVAHLREWCTSTGLPVTKTKVGSTGPTWGIRVDKVTDLLGRTPAEAITDLDTAPPERPPEQPGEGAEQAAPTPRPAPLPDGTQKPDDKPRLGLLTGPSPEAAADPPAGR